MFSKIMVPVDLAHLDSQERALDCGAGLAGFYGATMVFVGVTTEMPDPIAHSSAEYAEKLKMFAQEQATRREVGASSHVMIAHDPTVDLDDALLRAVNETGSDFVVMASHDPGIAEYIWPSNGGKLASHSHASVLVVRG